VGVNVEANVEANKTNKDQFMIDPTSFDPITGLAESDITPLRRRLSDMRGMFQDEAALEEMIATDDRLIYEFYDMGIPESPENLAFGTSILYPGKVNDEFFMTKGHFHVVLETAEVYYGIRGKGLMLMENPEGQTMVQEIRPGAALYVPGRYAHRSINISADEPLITFFTFRADAGHDYGTIEEKGYRKVVVERKGAWELGDNPRWGE
jgi:glucose-6-phosphate isomerase, archaeal